MYLPVLILFFVNIAFSEIIYKINVADDDQNITTVNTNKKLRILLQLGDGFIRKHGDTLCSNKTKGKDHTLTLQCIIEDEWASQIVHADANIDNSTSIFDEWKCKFNATTKNKIEKSIDEKFTMISEEHEKERFDKCVGSNDKTDNSCWIVIGIVAILINIFEAIYIIHTWLKSKGFEIPLKLRLTNDVLDSSNTTLASPPPPPLLPKISKQDTTSQSPSTRMKNIIKIKPVRAIDTTQQIEEAPKVAGYEDMTRRLQYRMGIPSIMRASSEKTYHEISIPQNLYENDSILFNPPPLEKRSTQTVKTDSKLENGTNSLPKYADLKPVILSSCTQIVSDLEASQKIPAASFTNASNLPILTPYNIRELVESKAVTISEPIQGMVGPPATPKRHRMFKPKISGPVNLLWTTASGNESETSDDEWDFESVNSEKPIYKNIP